MNDIKRCEWTGNDEKMIQYHDAEWGVPVKDDQKLFEYFVLDAFQAGLSWKTILHKRENFRKAFDNFDPEKIALYNSNKVNTLLQDSGIIRNRLKIQATIHNARQYKEIQAKYESFSTYIWSFVQGEPIINKWHSLQEVPATSSISDKMSKDLKQKGFKFVGSTICYAFMQAAGLVNDHTTGCFRYKQG